LNGFYRESGYHSDTYHNFLFSEGVIQVVKQSMSNLKDYPDDRINLVKGYRYLAS